jgi:MtN3 and saliva related transmembrane protein
MAFTEVVGYCAMLCTTTSIFPQAFSVLKSRNTANLSLPMYAILTMGLCLWLIYGLRLGDLPLIIANAVTLIPTSIILAMKLREKKYAVAK